MNGWPLPVPRSWSRCLHVGQQCFGIPMIDPQPFHNKWDSNNKNKLETWPTLISANMPLLTVAVPSRRLARQALQCTMPREPHSSFRESKKLAATWCPWRFWVLNCDCQTVPECLLRKQLLLYPLWLPPVPSKITSGLSHWDRTPYFFLQDVKWRQKWSVGSEKPTWMKQSPPGWTLRVSVTK